MNRTLCTLWLATPVLAILASGCVVRARPAPVVVGAEVDYGTVYPTVPPPAPLAEYRPAPPGYGYYWVDGYWDWTGYDWSWNAGLWAPERPGYVYVRPRYQYEGGRYVLYRGYWNDGYGRRDYHYNNSMRGTPPPGGWRGAPPPGGGGMRGAPPPTAPSGWRASPAPAPAAPAPGWRAQPGGPATAPPPSGGPGWRAGGAPPPSSPAPTPGAPAGTHRDPPGRGCACSCAPPFRTTGAGGNGARPG